MAMLPTGGDEATILENMEALYASIRSLGTEEEDNITFPYWKVVDDYRYPADPNFLSANFAAVFLEVASLLYPRLELTVILNTITQDNNKVLEDDNNETVKFYKMERSTEETVSTFQSVFKAEQWNSGTQKIRPLAEN